MNHKITQIFVPTAVSAASGGTTGSLTTDALVKQVLGVYNPNTFANIGTSTIGTESDFFLAIGSGSTKYGSFKTSTIKVSNIISAVKTVHDNTTKQQISYIGFDEVNDFKTPSFSCDEEYVVTLKISEYWSKGIFQPLIQESVSIKTACCADCAGGCDSLGCSTYMSDLAAKINASPLLSKYVTASYVYKGSLPVYKYTLTVPDTFGTGAAATYITSTLQPAFPAGTYGTITLTADADGADDANTTGNTMFEIATPLVDIALMPVFNGVAWEKVLVTAAAVTACGVKITGNALDEFGNACVPDAVPYIFNLVRFKVNIHEGPYNTQDFDIENFCAAIPVTTTQEIKYPIGAGVAIAEMERHYFGNNLPATADARRYWNPIYNEDSNNFLYVNSGNLYDMYEITYLDASAVGFEKKSENTHSIIILAASVVAGTPSSTLSTAVATALNNVLPTSLHV
tara:strand:+ start:4648 stop:6015 length:1368 start_codon:yes stop_codon:yes gene_type:complete